MQQQTLSVGETPNVVVKTIPGDLRVAGWDRAEIMAKTDGSVLEIDKSDPVTISCDESLILYLPDQANLNVEGVSGDACFQALRNPITLGFVSGSLSMRELGSITASAVSGDLALRGVGSVRVESVSGDLALRGAQGDCSIDSIGGDASVRDVEGSMALENVGSDLFLRNVNGSITARAGSDVSLYLTPVSGAEYHIAAGDDLLLRLPEDADVELHLKGGSSESVHLEYPGVTLDGESEAYDLTLGKGTAKMFLTAGDDLIATTRATRWEAAADFGVEMGDAIPEWPDAPEIPYFPGMPPNLSDRINQRLMQAREKAHRRVEEAMRKSEAKLRAAERHAYRSHSHGSRVRWSWDINAKKSAEQSQPVTDEERLSILNMLQEKKITLEEAEKLLSALEGKE